jgi:hypothetical protein
MKNQQIAIIIGLILILGIGLYFGMGGKMPGLSVVPVPAEGKTCPAGDICQATALLDCTTPKSMQYVNVRMYSTNADSNLWIALDLNKDGAIDSCWKKTASILGSCVGTDTELRTPTSSYVIKAYNSQIIVCGSSNYIYSTDYSCEMSTTSIPAYANGREGYGGNGPQYVCSKDLFIDNIKTETVSYSGLSATTGYRGATHTISAGQTVTYSGSIDWVETPIPITQCTFNGNKINQGQSICDGNTKKTCSTPPGFVDTNCQLDNGKVCMNGVCKIPYTQATTFGGAAPTDINRYTVGNSVDVKLVLSEITPQPRTVSIELKDLQGVTKFSKSATLDQNDPSITVTIPSQVEGQYTLEVKIPAISYSTSYVMRWSNGVSLSIVAGPGRDSSVQYESDLIIVRVLTYVSGQKQEVYGYPDVQATFNDQMISYKSRENPDQGTYDFYYDLSNKGTGHMLFKARAMATSNAPYTNWTAPTDFKVEAAQLAISPMYFIGSSADKSALTATTYTVGFDITASNNPVDAVCSASVSEPDNSQMQISTIAHMSTGKYSFQLPLRQAQIS